MQTQIHAYHNDNDRLMIDQVRQDCLITVKTVFSSQTSLENSFMTLASLELTEIITSKISAFETC